MAKKDDVVKRDFIMDTCGACRTCEIACSYHHTGEFNHQVSSIEIVERKDGGGYDVRIYQKNNGERIACDGCLDVDGDPLCIQYCREAEDLKKIIGEIVDASKAHNESGVTK